MMRKIAWALLAAALIALVIVARRSDAASFDSDPPLAPCPVSSSTLYACPHATVGQRFSLQLTGHDGCDLYWFRIDSGALPPGLTMSRSGLVSGTPTAVGQTTPWISIHDLLPSEGGYGWCAGDNQSERQFQFTTDPSSTPAPPPPSDPLPLKWYWHLLSGSTLLHSERAVTHADGRTGLGNMLRWERAHKGVVRARGSVLLVHVQAAS
jgi:hypothetical protein